MPNHPSPLPNAAEAAAPHSGRRAQSGVVRYNRRLRRAGVAQLVEYKLPKLGVAGSNPVARSNLTIP
jgi:hypothetical protein